MSWLWQNYDPGAAYHTSETIFDPGEECLSTQASCQEREVNPLPRFADIFVPLHSENWPQEEIPLKVFENIIYHHLAQIDRLCGYHALALMAIRQEAMLYSGAYGNHVIPIFHNLSRQEKDAITTLLFRQDESKGGKLYFPEALRALFPGARLYYNESEERLLAILPEDESGSGRQKTTLLEHLFLEMTALPPRYFWNRNICIIDDAMGRIDQSVIY